MGENHAVHVEDELVAEATKCFGADDIRFEVVDVGHKMLVTHGDEVVDLI